MKLALRRWALGASAVVPIVALGFCGYHAYRHFRVINEEVLSGSAYGFVIGQAKLEAYAAAQALHRTGSADRISVFGSHGTERRRNPWLHTPQPLAEVRAVFDQWTIWTVWTGGNKSAQIRWEGDQVTRILVGGAETDEWPTSGDRVRIGDSYDSVYCKRPTPI